MGVGGVGFNWGGGGRTPRAGSRVEGAMEPERDQEEPTGAVAPSRWKRVGVWVERIVTWGLVAFVIYRVGPQLGALTGVGPDLGRAPEFSFVSFDGDTIRSEALRGRVVVLNFWATWCGPCKLEMPSLQALSEDMDPEDVIVLGLATDVGRAGPIRAFLRERSISYPVGRATVAHRQAFGGIRGIPTTFLIDREGVVRHRVVGYFAPPAMRAAVSRLVEEGRNGKAS
jgi:cytochrome c biogenesis protein CcmG, thiol:disulfide interchange protein DsbE